VLAVTIALCACGSERPRDNGRGQERATGAQAPPAIDAAPVRAIVQATLSDEDLLADGAAKRLTTRTRLRAFRTLRLSADGAPVVQSDTGREENPRWAPELAVVEQTTERVRVVSDDLAGGGALPDQRLLLWVDRDDLHTVVRAPTGLAAKPDQPPNPNGPSIGLSPGVALPVLARDGDWMQVSHGHGDLHFRGWVAFADVGQVYDFGAWEEAPAPTAMVRGGEPLLDAPNGDLIATFAPPDDPVEPRFRIAVNTLGGRIEGHQHIRYVYRGVEARGYVRVDSLSTDDLRSGGFGRGISHGYSRVQHSQRIELPVRACMYDGVDGKPIGVALRAIERDADPVADAPGWWRVAVYPLFWKGFDVWVRDESAGSGGPRWLEC
jgi:hypothetical protein